MHLIKTDFNGNVNVGLYAYATDKYCIVGREVPKKQAKDIEKALKVPVHQLNIAGTSLVGVFLAGNSNCLLVPETAFKQELKELDKLKIKYEVINTKLTALGNNVLANDNGCLVNPEFTKTEMTQIEKALGVEVKPVKIAGLEIVGALAVINDKGCLVHRDAEEFELDLIEKTLDTQASIGTVNFGSPYIKSGLIANSNGFIIGNISGGPEIQNADETLGFIDN